MYPNNLPPRVEYESDSLNFSNNRLASSTTPKIIQWCINNSGGLIKDQKQAQTILLLVTVLLILISIFIFFKDDNVSREYKEQQKLYPVGSPALR